MSAAPQVVTLCTSWGSTHGGVNSFNTDLSLALAALGCEVTCICLRATSEEIAHARTQGVRLLGIQAPINRDKLQPEDAPEIAAALRAAGVSPNLWITHDLTSSHPAAAARDLVQSRAPIATIHHMHFLSYKTIEGSAQRAEEKHNEQRALLARADIVFGVGPKLTGTARDHLLHKGAQAPPVFQLVPGLPRISPVSAPSQLKLFFAGRLSGASAKLKQVKLAVASFGRLVSRHGNFLPADPILTLLGSDQAPEAATELRLLAQTAAGRHVAILDIPFTTDRTQLLASLADHSAAMLLSVHEGFGLTAWESIGAGVPLVISKNSGVFQFLRTELGGPATGCVLSVDIKSSSVGDTPAEDDIGSVTDCLARIAADPRSARIDALRLRTQLSEYTWERTARTLLEAVGIRVPTSPEARTEHPTQQRPKPSADQAVANALPGPRRADDVRAVLFDIYDEQCRDYYIRRSADADLSRLKSSYHLWVWGETGVGKTTALRHLAMESMRYEYISMTSCIGQPPTTLAAFLLEEISTRIGFTDTSSPARPLNPVTRQLARALASDQARDVCFHIDEVPLEGVEEGRNFTRLLASVLMEHSNIAPSSSARVFLSTIEDPTPHLGPSQQRVRERLAVFKMNAWSEPELRELCDLAISSFGGITNASGIDQIVRRAAGSPRFVKNCLRKLVLFKGDAAWPLERILNESAGETAS